MTVRVQEGAGIHDSFWERTHLCRFCPSVIQSGAKNLPSYTKARAINGPGLWGIERKAVG